MLACCDNMAVINIVNHGSSKNQEAMYLARCLAFITAKFDFHIMATHISGALNTQTDVLSRNDLLLFRLLHLQASQEGTLILQSLLDLLILSRPDWMSKHWTELWSTIFGTG